MCQGTQTPIPPALQYAVECRWFEVQPNGVPFCGCQTWCEWVPNTILLFGAGDDVKELLRKYRIAVSEEQDFEFNDQVVGWMGSYDNDYVCINTDNKLCRRSMTTSELDDLLNNAIVVHAIVVNGNRATYLYGVKEP
jgi:hypothetical protein